MRLRHLPWIVIPLVVGGASYLARSGELSRHWAMWAGADPMIELPPSLELGEREIGEIVFARFSIANRGRGVLVVDDIKTNCACSGLEREENGQFIRVEQLRVGPRDKANLLMRLSVRGPSGGPMRNRVSFRTNDPARLEAGIEAVVTKVTGGVTTTPASLVFGTVALGSQVRQTLEVRDDARSPRTVERVSCTDPGRVGVKFLPVQADELGRGGSGAERVIGRVEVVLRANEIGPINDEVQIHYSGETQRPVIVPV